MRNRPIRTLFMAAGFMATGLTFTTSAHAGVLDRMNNTLDNLFGVFSDFSPEQVYNVKVGIGPSLDPRFRGDNDVHLSAVPVVSLRYRDLVSVENNHVRINFLGKWGNMTGSTQWSAGPIIHFDFGRDESDSPKLRGLGNIGTSFELGAYVGYRTGPYKLRLSFRQDVTNGHHGMLVVGQTSANLASGRNWNVSGNMELTWASGAYMSAFYGVTPAQSVASGLPVYQAKAGLHDLAFNFVGTYQLNRKWSLLGTMGISRLLSSAANNPLVEQRGSPNQAQIAGFVIYSF
jgi:outer membrane scaffolding protein for murein synthesis (MipA/OmpV family)